MLEINLLKDILANWEVLTEENVIIAYSYSQYTLYNNGVPDNTVILNVNLFNTLKSLGLLTRLENTIPNNAVVEFTIPAKLKSIPVLKMLERLMVITYQQEFHNRKEIEELLTQNNFTFEWDTEFDYSGTVGGMSYAKGLQINDRNNNEIFVPYGQSDSYKKEKFYYYNKFYEHLLSYYLYLKGLPFDINDLLNAKYTLTINPTPIDANVILTCKNYVQSGNTISVGYGETISYTVSKSGYGTQTGEYTIYDSDVTLDIELPQLQVTLTVNTIPNNVTVNFSGENIISTTAKTVTTYAGSNITYTVSATDYNTYTNSILLEEDTTVNVTLEQTQVTLTVNTTPSNATVNFSGIGIVSTDNNVATVYAGSNITYTVSAPNYVTQTNSTVVSDNMVVRIILNKQVVTITINASPSGSTVQFSNTSYISKTSNSITVNAGTTVGYTVSKSGYTSYSSSIVATSNQTINVTLSQSEYFVLDSDLTKVGSPTITSSGLASGFSFTSSAMSSSNVKGNYFSFNVADLSKTNWEMQIKFKATDVTTTQGLSGLLDWNSVSSTFSAYGCRFEIESGKLKILIGLGNNNTGGMDISNGGISIAVNTDYTVKVSYNGTAYKINCNGTETTYTSSNKIVWTPNLPLGGRMYRPVGSYYYSLISAKYCTIDLMKTYIKSNGSYVIWNTNILPSS